MTLGLQLLAWRQFRQITQNKLEQRSGISRPYLSRLERGEIDPSLNTLRRLAAAFEIKVGDLVDKAPHRKKISKSDINMLAIGAIKPIPVPKRLESRIRTLSRAFRQKRIALGFLKPRKSTKPKSNSGIYSLRKIRAEIGETQWRALLNRIDLYSAKGVRDSSKTAPDQQTDSWE